MAKAARSGFERMAETGGGDAGALAMGLRQGGVTSLGLRALAAKAVHVAAAAPERLTDIYDNAAAGWLGGPTFPPRTRLQEPLPLSAAWWKTLWAIVSPPFGVGRQGYAQQMMELAGQLDPRINARMAAVALEFPGVREAAAKGIADPYDVEWLAQFPPASLAYALSQEILRLGSPAADPYWIAAIPYLRHMPPPLNHINVTVIQSLPLWALVAGYTTRALDRVALGGFLMGQVGHHYSALASAVTLTTAATTRPEHLEIILDCLFKGWAHGRESPPLITVDWTPLWAMRVDQARQALQLTAFESPYAGDARPAPGWEPRVV